MEAEKYKNLAEILYMSVFIRTKDQNVIDVNKTEWKVT